MSYSIEIDMFLKSIFLLIIIQNHPRRRHFIFGLSSWYLRYDEYHFHPAANDQHLRTLPPNTAQEQLGQLRIEISKHPCREICPYIIVSQIIFCHPLTLG